MAHPPPSEEECEDRQAEQRLPQVGLHLPGVVQAAEEGRDVDEAVQRLPATAEAAHRAPRGSERQRHEDQQRDQADRDERALEDVLADGVELERAVHGQVEQEVTQHGEERGQAEGPAQVRKRHPAGRLPQRRDRERREQEIQAPDAERVEDLLDGICAEIDACDPRDPGRHIEKGTGAGEVDQRFQHEPEPAFARHDAFRINRTSRDPSRDTARRPAPHSR